MLITLLLILLEKIEIIKNSEIFNVPVNLSINTKNKILENKEYSSTLNYNSTALQSKNNKLGKKIFSNSNNQNLLHISSNNSNNINKEVNEKTKLNLNDLIKSSTDSVCYINNASDKNKILTSATFKKQLLERNKKSTNSQYNKNKIFDGISKFSLSSNFNQLKNSDKCVNNAYTTLNSNYSNLKDLLKKFDRKSKNSNSSIQTKDMKKYSINSKNLK